MFSNLFKQFSPRLIYGLIFFFCLTLIAYAYYVQLINGIESCPLCVVQRIIFALIAIIALAALMHHCRSWGNWIYSLIILAWSICGIKIASHHVWLQHLPESEWPPSCGMPLAILYKKIPLSGFIHTILSGSAECAAVSWKIFGISAPQLSLSAYIILALAALYILFYPKDHNHINRWKQL